MKKQLLTALLATSALFFSQTTVNAGYQSNFSYGTTPVYMAGNNMASRRKAMLATPAEEGPRLHSGLKREEVLPELVNEEMLMDIEDGLKAYQDSWLNEIPEISFAGKLEDNPARKVRQESAARVGKAVMTFKEIANMYISNKTTKQLRQQKKAAGNILDHLERFADVYGDIEYKISKIEGLRTSKNPTEFLQRNKDARIALTQVSDLLKAMRGVREVLATDGAIEQEFARLKQTQSAGKSPAAASKKVAVEQK